jgi:hypothetical protein
LILQPESVRHLDGETNLDQLRANSFGARRNELRFHRDEHGGSEMMRDGREAQAPLGVRRELAGEQPHARRAPILDRLLGQTLELGEDLTHGDA